MQLQISHTLVNGILRFSLWLFICFPGYYLTKVALSTSAAQDPTWHMDTSVSSHLNFNASNLSMIFYKLLFPSVHVGDCKSISVTNTGHSIIPSHHRPLHLHNVLIPHPGQGILGPTPAIYASQATTLPIAFSTVPLQDPTWHMDTSASSHLNFNASNLSTIFYKRLFPSVHVGDGKSIPVTNTGHSIIPSHHRPLHLHNVLVTPNIIKNLISVRQFTRDNNCTIEFDAFGFSVKDYLTRHILLRCDSSGDLYPVTKPSTSPIAFLSTSASTWHQRLGHPGDQVLRSLVSSRFISCNKEKSSHICHACQLGKHVKLPFHSSDSIVEHCFDIIHSDLWTSPIISSSGFKYYVLFLDHFSHYLWIYPLRSKSDIDLSETVYMHQPPGFVDNRQGSQVAYLLIYVDDIILTASCLAILQQIIDHTPKGLFLSHKKYALQLLERAGMVTCNCSRTPVDIESKLGPEVQQICLYMHNLRESHLAALKRILRYVQRQAIFAMLTDADWAGCQSTRGSTSSFCVFLGDNLLAWSAKRQHTLSRSSAEVEYRSVVNVVAETAWLRNLLRELHSPLSTATLVYCDNVSAFYMSVNPVQHQRTKHIEIDIHFVRDMVTAGQVRVLHVPSCFQYADIFTKGLPSALFENIRYSLSDEIEEYTNELQGRKAGLARDEVNKKATKNEKSIGRFDLDLTEMDGCTGYSKEQMKQNILKQHSIFRHQIQELHRLYKRQRDLMNELTRKEHCNVTMLTKAATSRLFLSQLLSRKVVDLELPADVDGDTEGKQPLQNVQNFTDLNKQIQVEEASFSTSIINNKRS
ncbi:ribonuclease H-like domain-containing protein [Tanacetum coccineum]|uniref:Ribonuclease H-like domain-containing protein n=1 Tax=Tanacetum coccineum TaxID=301880 RepID=A0ABQ4Y617_9ASTR